MFMFAGACRAARSSLLAHLPAAQVLQRIDDDDALQCRQVPRRQSSIILLALVTFLTVLALWSDVIHDIVLELVIPGAWCMFLVCNALLINVNMMYLVYLYILLFCLIVFYVVIMHPVISFVRSQKGFLHIEGVLTRARHRWAGTKEKHPMVHYEVRRRKSLVHSVLMKCIIWVRIQVLRFYLLLSRLCCKGPYMSSKESIFWQNMNRNAYLHGVVNTVSDETSPRDESVLYPIIRRGFIPDEILQMTRESKDDASAILGCMQCKKVLSVDPYQLDMLLPVQCPPVSTIESGAAMLVLKFKEILHSDFGVHNQPNSVEGYILVLPATEVCDCASYVLSSFHIGDTLLTEREFQKFSASLSDVLTNCSGFLDCNSLVHWFNTSMTMAMADRDVTYSEVAGTEQDGGVMRTVSTQTTPRTKLHLSNRKVQFHDNGYVGGNGGYVPLEVEVIGAEQL